METTITSIIFSKNRACQLDLLLRSMRQNLPFFNDIWILYHATTPEFQDGYNLLFEKEDNLGIRQQTDFEQDTRGLLSIIHNIYNSEYVCFFVDDNIVYRPSIINYEFVNRIFTIPELTCFTLRLGINTVVQDQYNNQPTIFPENIMNTTIAMSKSVDGINVLVWNWQTIKTFGNFGYPFSVDGHIYRTKDILPLLDYEFDNPNAFEGRFDKSRFGTNLMCCFEESVVVNNPLNIVGSSNNNAGWWYGHTLEDLNQKYLDNHQISLNSIMEREVFAAHQEMEIEFEKI